MNSEMRKIECLDPTIGELLVPYGLGTLSEEEAARFEDHLLECDFCRIELEAGFETFSTLRDFRPDLVRKMRDTAEDFESLLAGQRVTAKPVREREPFLERWRRALGAVLNPWVYGPVTAATLAVFLVVHFSGGSPSVLTMPMPPSAPIVSHNLMRLHSESVAPPAQTPPSQVDRLTPLAKSTPPAAEIAPLQDEIAVPRESRRTMVGVSPKAVRVPKGNAPPETRVPDQAAAETVVPYASPRTAAPQTDVAQKEERMSEESALTTSPVAALRQRALALLSTPPPISESDAEPLQQDLQIRGGRAMSIRGPEVTEKQSARLPGKKQSASDSVAALNFLIGISAYLRNDFPVASTAFEQSVHADSSNARAWYYLGVSRAQQRQWINSAYALGRADTLYAGNDPVTRYYRSLATIVSGDLPKGKELIGSIASRPDSLGMRAAEIKQLLDQTNSHK